MNIAEKLKSEPRIVISAVIFTLFAMPWMSVSSSVEGMGESVSGSAAMSGYLILRHAFLAYFILLLPLAFIALEMTLKFQSIKKLLYLFGSLASIVLCFFSTLLAKSSGSVSVDVADIEAKTSVHYKFGFWLTIAAFLAILIVTVIKDFAINKETLAAKGLSGALNDVASQVASSTNELSSDIKSGNFGALGDAAASSPEKATFPCPNCGAGIAVGKKFCNKCGTKIDSPVPMPKKAETKKSNPHALLCEACGTGIPNGKKFCPDCGSRAVYRIVPTKCEACGASLLKGKKYCGDCGAEVVIQTMPITCAKCNADLIVGKSFCGDCGEPITFNKEAENEVL